MESGWDEERKNDLTRDKKELDDILIMKEEAMARDKARITWLKEGDRNTAFFHASIKARRIQNNQIQFQREDGNFTTDRDTIGQAAVEYYQNLFNQYTPSSES